MKYRVRVEGWDVTGTRKRAMQPMDEPFMEGDVKRHSLLETEAEAAALVAELTIKNNRNYDYVAVDDSPPQP